MEELKNESINEWKKYLDEIYNRYIEMYNMIYYNQFTNEEIRRLQRTIKFIKDDLLIEKIKNGKIKQENKILSIKVESLKDEKLKYKLKKRKTLSIDTYKNQFIDNINNKRPKTINYLTKKDHESKLSEIFKNIKYIKDIILLKNNDNIYDFMRNDKYYKLLKIIPILEKIDSIIGMDDIKNEIFVMICYYIHGLNNSNELNHIVITGQPGVGKTTLAQYLGELYCCLGFLKNKTFIKAKRSDLIAEYLGQTAIKTQKVIDSAEGGVLFIDEVYSLGNIKKNDSYAKECIDTININLTEKSDKLLVIIAGYKDDIQSCFFNYNKGLERRFTLRFDIKTYNYNELYNIFKKVVKDNKWHLSLNVTKEIFKNNYKYFNSGMAGDMITLFKYAKEDFSKKLMKSVLNINNIVKEISLKNVTYAINKIKSIKEQTMPKIPEWYINMLA